MKNIIKFTLLCCVIVLNACISLLPEAGPAPKRLWLDPAMTSSPFQGSAIETIAVTRPTSSDLLDSHRLRIRDLSGEIAFVDQIAGVEWQEHLPLMVQRHLVLALKTSRKFKAVGFSDDTFRRDVVLETDIQNFDVVVLEDKMYAEVTLSAKLLKAKGREVIWQHTLTSKAPITEHTLAAFVTGLTTAYEMVLLQITEDVG